MLCIPQEYCFTQYYVWNKMDCNYNKILQMFLWKSYTKDWNGPLWPGAILVHNSNKITDSKENALNTECTASEIHSLI